MKKQNTSLKRSLLLATTVIAILMTNSGSVAAQKAGARFGAREPRTCPDKTKPLKGAITPAEATKYLICGMEGADRNYLYLLEEVSVTVGRGVPYDPKTYAYARDIDVTYPTFPIRASYKQYTCGPTADNPGKNCNLYVVTNATGVCYRTTFGDWSCSAASFDDKKTEYNVAPPK